MAPALSLFGLYGSVLMTCIFFEYIFYMITASLVFITTLWIGQCVLGSLVAAYRVRQETKKDWNLILEKLQEEDPEASEVLHIVILPNFQENEQMLMETLANIALAPMATSRIRVVLGMEAREGPGAREKADRLIQQTQHLFADIFATYHPAGLPGEVAGKSSNTQYAFRSAMRHYGPILMGIDLSRVFVTVGDADTLWHPQYFSALTYQALTMGPEERAWTIWQPPILLLRNIFTVPAMTRASSHATLIFEMSAITNQLIFPAFAYSAYSLSLALASHPEVDGWDVDVIAEDHHMFLKCYFAALWERAHASKSIVNGKITDNDKKLEKPIKPIVKVDPVYLPAVSYLVESSEGYVASMWARFQQARRHSQGVVELGYVLLQYCRLASTTGFTKLPARTHVAIILVALKIQILHIISTAQCFAMIVVALRTTIPSIIRRVVDGGITPNIAIAEVSFLQLLFGGGALNAAQQFLAICLNNLGPCLVLYAIICFVVILDLVEGRYYALSNFQLPQGCGSIEEEGEEEDTPPNSPKSFHSAEEDACKEGSEDLTHSRAAYPGVPTYVLGPLTLLQKIMLFLSIVFDTLIVAYNTCFIYAVVPVCLAAWSLLRRGTDFEYIVGEKPT